MDYDDVLERFRTIQRISGDDEVAHAREDQLHQDVLREIATHSTDPLSRVLAQGALRTQDLDFERWYA